MPAITVDRFKIEDRRSFLGSRSSSRSSRCQASSRFGWASFLVNYFNSINIIICTVAAAPRISSAYEDGTLCRSWKAYSSCHWPGSSSNFYLVMTLPDSGNHSYLSNSEKLKIVHVPTFGSAKIAACRSQIADRRSDLLGVYAMQKWLQLISRRAFRKSR